MSLTYNGTEVKDVTYNGVSLDAINFNGTEIWKRFLPTNFVVGYRDYNTNYYTMLSSDAYNWRQVRNGVGCSQIVYGNGLYVGITNNSNNVYFSGDGETWTSRALTGQYPAPKNIVYGNGKFIIGQMLGIAVSSDGIAWTHLDQYVGNKFAYGNGMFVSIGSYYSTDGENWIPISGSVNTIAYGNGVFIGSKGQSIYILSGMSEWSYAASSAQSFTDLKFAGDKFFGLTSSTFYVSEDGFAWREVTSLRGVTDVIYVNGMYVACGNYNGKAFISISVDATNWINTYTSSNAYGTEYAYCVAVDRE